MNIALRLLVALMVALAVAACSSTQEAPTTDDDAPVVDQSDNDVTTTPLGPDPQDFTDSANLDNPDSILHVRNAVIYFDFDQSTVKAEYRPVVAAHAEYLAAHPNARVTLEGHADERGSREYNLGLGERRGNSVMGLLSAQGARGDQQNVVSYGEERPECRVSDEDCWGQNRRVWIVYTDRG